MRTLSTAVGSLLLVLACAATPALGGEREPGRELHPQGRGWVQVAEGVWQRTSGERVQTWAAGVAGMRYALGELERELAHATRAYLNDPSVEHEKALRAHLTTIERTRGFLGEGDGAGSAKAAAPLPEPEPDPSCDGYVYWLEVEADADPDPVGYGAAASSWASWSGRSPYWCEGTIYARATASVTTGGTTNTDEQICTLTGEVFSTSYCEAAAAETGSSGSTCSSSSFAYTASDDFPFYLSESAFNGNC